ncbi:MAG: cytochrome C biogenesis protein [candidate division Zixibacteria bacterium 4484_95]|nr:MAG: cytochrome C biogenesis protein [candidate division Zixibacteria bacterium 4484_95]
MDSFLLGITSAIWLGILTSISPCPLATNIAAISYIGKRLANPRLVFLSGLLYMLGRMLAYLILGIILVAGALSIPKLSYFLQENINKYLGPILIIAGIFLLELLPLNITGFGLSRRMQGHVEDYGIWGAFLLGIIFALSFCPISAALFFGSLIPLSIKYDSGFILPSLFGIGTSLPVILFAFLIGLSTRLVSKVFNRLTQVELWARRITGVIFVLVGLYYSLVYIFRISL